MTGQILLNN